MWRWGDEGMNGLKCGILINMAGKGHYLNPDAPDRLIRYVTRTNGKPSDDLVACGGVGVAEFTGTDGMIGQFHAVQGLHKRKGSFGRYADHEVYSFSSGEERLIQEKGLDVDGIARKMAYDFYEKDKCQVVYGVHRPDSGNGHLHVHFAVNTVNYITGGKRRENKRQTRERQERFGLIVKEELEIS